MDRRGLLGSICGAFVAVLPLSKRRRIVHQKVTCGLALHIPNKPGIERVWLQDTASDNSQFPIVVWEEFRVGTVVSGRKYLVTIEEA